MKKYIISVIVIICSCLYAVNEPVKFETEWILINTPSIPALGPFEDFGRTKRGQVFEWVLTPVSSPGLDREYYVNGPKAGQPTGSTSPVVVTFEPPEAKGKGIPQRWGRYTWTRTFKGSWVSRQKDANGGNLKGEQNQLVSGTVMVTGGRNNPDPENGVGDPGGGAIKPPFDDAPDLNDPDCTNPFTPEIADPFENPDERESVDLEEPSQVELIAENILTFKDKVGFDTFVTSEPPKKYLTMSGKTELGGDHNAESPVGGTFVDKKDRATGQRIRTAQSGNPSYYGYNIEGAEKTEISIISMHEVDDYDDCPNHEPDEPGIMKVELTLSEEYTTQMMKEDVVSHSHAFKGEGYYRQETPNAEWQSHNDETLFAYAKTKYKIRVPEDVPRPYQATWVEEFTPKDEDPDDDVYPEKEYEFKSVEISGDESQTYTIDPADSSKEGTWQVYLFSMGVAVDADRDGEISFDEKDMTTAQKPYRFWINDDRDIHHMVDALPPPAGHHLDFEQDDVNADKQANVDYDEPGLNFERDLEDLTRIWVNLGSVGDLIGTKDMQLKVRMDAVSNSPKINLFEACEKDGSRLYLQDEAIGSLQLGYGDELCKVVGSTSVEVPKDAWDGAVLAGNVCHFLFEGADKGTGKVVFELWKSGKKLGDLPPIHLKLREAHDFYETWSVGDVQSPQINNANDNYSVWPKSVAEPNPFLYDYDLNTPVKPEEKDYIMFVHGWNMTSKDKDQFADTMYKRLWHQGFKGRFGAYRWPTFHVPGVEVNNFNGSEERAWNSAAPLAALLQNRASIFNVGGESRVRVFGHSMGNIVCSEALRQYGAVANAPVHTYISGQAALAAHCWDADNPRRMNMGIQWSNTANVYRGYWQPAAGGDAPHKWEEDGRPSYMHSSYMPSNVTYVNHFNIDDWALASWELNQKLKPSIGYHYGWVPGSALGSEHRFYKNLVSPTTLLWPADRFQIFSWAAEARSYATGAEPATGGIFTKPRDLNALFGFGPNHKGHSAQFRSTIQKRWTYWTQFLRDCNISLTPP